jgi:hypothetical protein
MAQLNQARPVRVALPAQALTLQQSQEVLAQILKELGHGGCFSGRDIDFRHEVEFFVTQEGRVQQSRERVA